MIEVSGIKDNEVAVTYKLSEGDIKVLEHLKKYNYMEFRNDKNSEVADNLMSYGFVTSYDYSWHFTIKLTKLGQQVVESMN